MKLSVITITKDEAENIERCIKSARFADEHIVIDCGSSDNTVEIASRAGAKVIHHGWEGYGPQKNYGLSQAQGEWVLFIDADEEVAPELAEEIKNITSGSAKDFYWLKIVTVFLSRPLKHLYGHNPRLFRKDAGCWTDAKVHEQIITKNNQVIKLGDEHSWILKNYLLHHSHKTFKSYLETMHKYTELDAEQMVKTGKHRSGRSVKTTRWLPLWLAVRQFIKLMFYRKGFLDGCEGWAWCFLSAYYEYEMSVRFLFLSKNSGRN